MLTYFLAEMELALLGVDVPAIDSKEQPYGAVNALFQANTDMLLLAPLSIDLSSLKTGMYTLCAFPLKISDVCASLCRAVLIEQPQQSAEGT